MKTPKYLLCQNKQAKNTDHYLLHTQHPRYLARINFGAIITLDLADDFGVTIEEAELQKQFEIAIKRIRSYIF